jgi:hypothetical protein
VANDTFLSVQGKSGTQLESSDASRAHIDEVQAIGRHVQLNLLNGASVAPCQEGSFAPGL